jgi:hypothetical protein
VFLVNLKKKSKEFEVARTLFGLAHLDRVLESKANIIESFNEEMHATRGHFDVSKRRFEEEDIELERRTRVATGEFKTLMKINRLLPLGLYST